MTASSDPASAENPKPIWTVETLKRKFLADQERLDIGVQDKDQFICSIRVKTLQGEAARNPPPLGSWNAKYWVYLNTGTENKKNYILVNINSIAKNTGLTEQQIREAARTSQLEVVLFESIQKSKTLAKGIKSALTHTEKNVVKVPIDFSNNASDKDLCEAFNLTKSQLKKIKKEERLVIDKDSLVNVEGVRYANAYLKLEAPVGKELKEMIHNVLKLQKKVLANAAKKNAKQDGSTPTIEKKWKWKGIVSLGVYVKPDGQVYLSSLSKRVGRGACKEIWHATEVSTLEKVVIGMPHQKRRKAKWLKLHDARSIEHERKMLVAAQGPGVCEYRACVNLNVDSKGRITTSGGSPGIIQRYYNGGELADSIEALGNQEPLIKYPQQILIMKKLAEGLNHLHNNKKIVHRDIKTGNVLLQKNEQGRIEGARFIDFGLSQFGEEPSGGFQGTPYYLSPRQVDDGGGTFSDDIWALGILFLEMINPEFLARIDIGNTISLFFMVKMSSPSDLRSLLTKEQMAEFNEKFGGDKGAYEEYLKGQVKAKGATFGTERPEVLGLSDPPTQVNRFDMAQNKMEILCWDMLFASPPFKAEDVFKCVQEIDTAYESYV